MTIYTETVVVDGQLWISNGAENILLKVIEIDDDNFVGSNLRELPPFLEYYQIGSLISFERKHILRKE